MHLAVSDVKKRFGDHEVLAGVDLELEPGRVVGLVGENGAGKSTLIRVITGALAADGGELRMDGKAASHLDTRSAMDAGIHAIYQELRQNLFPQLTVAENIYMLDDARRFGRTWVRKASMERAAAELLASIGIDIDPLVRVGELSVAEQQMVELASAVEKRLEVLILDEPTAALDDAESQQLFAQIRRLQKMGIAVLYVSHRLEEVFDLSDRIVVLRDGRVSLDGATNDLTSETVVAAMVGRSIENFYPKTANSRDDVVLAVEGLTRVEAFTDVTFEVHAGEVLGIGGVMGCGKGVLLRTLFGELPPDSGRVLLDGRPVTPKGPRQAIQSRIGYVSADRQRDGLCLAQSVTSNITLPTLDRFARTGWVQRNREAAESAEVMSQLNVRGPSARTEVGQLSGGNQQKILFGKWLLANPRVLLLEEPTRGVDVGAKVEIYRHINRLSADGLAVVLVTSDLPELCEMSDRILVMRDGRMVAELRDGELTQENVLQHSLAGAA